MSAEVTTKPILMNDLLYWQMEQIEGHARLLQEHAADPTCACEVDLTSCLRKHCLMMEHYATETLPMVQDEQLINLLLDLSSEAREMKEKVAASVCGDGEAELDLAELTQFGRTWAKRVETGYTCPMSGQIEEVAMANPGIGEALATGAAIGAGLVVGQKVLEKDKGNGGSNPHSDKCIGGTLQIPIHSEKQLKHILASQKHLSQAGVSFDTGMCIGCKPQVRDWELDWSLKGATFRPCSSDNPIALSKCEKEHGLGPKLESCIFKLEELNIEKGCPPMGLGTKECPNPVAVCRASISQPVCSNSVSLKERAIMGDLSKVADELIDKLNEIGDLVAVEKEKAEESSNQELEDKFRGIINELNQLESLINSLYPKV